MPWFEINSGVGGAPHLGTLPVNPGDRLAKVNPSDRIHLDCHRQFGMLIRPKAYTGQTRVAIAPVKNILANHSLLERQIKGCFDSFNETPSATSTCRSSNVFTGENALRRVDQALALRLPPLWFPPLDGLSHYAKPVSSNVSIRRKTDVLCLLFLPFLLL